MDPREQMCTECALQDLHLAMPWDSISEQEGQADGARRTATPFQAENRRGAKAGRWKPVWRVPSPREGSGATGLGRRRREWTIGEDRVPLAAGTSYPHIPRSLLSLRDLIDTPPTTAANVTSAEGSGGWVTLKDHAAGSRPPRSGAGA